MEAPQDSKKRSSSEAPKLESELETKTAKIETIPTVDEDLGEDCEYERDWEDPEITEFINSLKTDRSDIRAGKIPYSIDPKLKQFNGHPHRLKTAKKKDDEHGIVPDDVFETWLQLAKVVSHYSVADRGRKLKFLQRLFNRELADVEERIEEIEEEPEDDEESQEL